MSDRRGDFIRASQLARLPNGNILAPLVLSGVLIGAPLDVQMMYASLLLRWLRDLIAVIDGERRN